MLFCSEPKKNFFDLDIVAVKEEPTSTQESVKLKEELVRAESKVEEYGAKIERLEKQMHCYDAVSVAGGGSSVMVMQDRTPIGKLKKAQPQQRTPVDLKIKSTPIAAVILQFYNFIMLKSIHRRQFFPFFIISWRNYFHLLNTWLQRFAYARLYLSFPYDFHY